MPVRNSTPARARRRNWPMVSGITERAISELARVSILRSNVVPVGLLE